MNDDVVGSARPSIKILVMSGKKNERCEFQLKVTETFIK